VRGERLEQIVWDQVRALLKEPGRVADEYRRRTSQAHDAPAPSEEIARIERQMSALQRGIARLIDAYSSGLIDKAEFEPRITALRQRMAQLSKQKHVAVEAANAEHELSLVISQLKDFSARVTQGLDQLDWLGKREIIHTLVRRIEIDQDDVEIVFRVQPPAGAAGPGPQGRPSRALAQHCTDVYARL
jgi:site-specific DNA recombinase